VTVLEKIIFVMKKTPFEIHGSTFLTD